MLITTYRFWSQKEGSIRLHNRRCNISILLISELWWMGVSGAGSSHCGSLLFSPSCNMQGIAYYLSTFISSWTFYSFIRSGDEYDDMFMQEEANKPWYNRYWFKVRLKFMQFPFSIDVFNISWVVLDWQTSFCECFTPQANVWIAIFGFVGNYFWTHYFYTVLGAIYTFPSYKINHVSFVQN